MGRRRRRDATAFTDEGNWVGGFYELQLELGPRDDDLLGRALVALWEATGADGPYFGSDAEPADQPTAPLTVAALDRGHLHGVVTLPGDRRTVCGCLALRMDGGVDVLDFYLPMGALERVEERAGGFPFGPDGGPASLAWRAPIDEWLIDVARTVYAAVDFRLALVGFEVDADLDAERLVAGGVPDERWHAALVPADDGLVYWPANR